MESLEGSVARPAPRPPTGCAPWRVWPGGRAGFPELGRPGPSQLFQTIARESTLPQAMSARAMLVALLLPAFCAGFAPPGPCAGRWPSTTRRGRAPRPVAMSGAAAPAGGLATSASTTMLAVRSPSLPQIRRIVRSRSALGLAPTARTATRSSSPPRACATRRGHPIDRDGASCCPSAHRRTRIACCPRVPRDGRAELLLVAVLVARDLAVLCAFVRSSRACPRACCRCSRPSPRRCSSSRTPRSARPTRVGARRASSRRAP